jgi:elongation factor G
MTGGHGRYTLALSHYEAVPPQVQQQLMAQHKAPETE